MWLLGSKLSRYRRKQHIRQPIHINPKNHKKMKPLFSIRVPKISDDIQNCVEVTSKVVTIIAIIVGGWWTYSNFIRFKEGAENLAVTVQATAGKAVNGKAITIIDVSLKNIGKVPVTAGVLVTKTIRGKKMDFSGCEITVIEYDTDSRKPESTAALIDWDNEEVGSKTVIDHYNILDGYAAFRNGNYVLNPGVEYHESMAFSAVPGKLYGIRARFFSEQEWSNSDIKYLSIPSI